MFSLFWHNRVQIYPLVVFWRVVVAALKLNFSEPCREILKVACQNSVDCNVLREVNHQRSLGFRITILENHVVILALRQDRPCIFHAHRVNNRGSCLLRSKIFPFLEFINSLVVARFGWRRRFVFEKFVNKAVKPVER